ncbi:MAG: hypothetical protein Q8S57_08210 [Methanoregula sp.]|nr:hypothetical protein [Methanoregula sp.]
MARRILFIDRRVTVADNPNSFAAGQHGRVFLQGICLIEIQEMTL